MGANHAFDDVNSEPGAWFFWPASFSAVLIEAGASY
jgi:hypothetical protein